MWISGLGLVALLIAVLVILWQEKPDSQHPGEAVFDPTLSQPIPR